VNERFVGRVAMVTGGGSGIGAAAARRFAAEGASVVVLDRKMEDARRIAAEFDSRGLALLADVSVEQEVETATAAAVDHFGKLDVAVNAAGYGVGAEIIDMSYEQWRGVIEVDLGGTFLVLKHAARAMLRRGGGGVVVNIASTNAVQPGEGLGAYCAAKAGVTMLTQVAALELASHGVRVVGVGPGLTATPLIAPLLADESTRRAWLGSVPLGRAAEPNEIAALIAWLASDEAAYLTGETVYMDGGLRARSYPALAQRRPAGYAGPAFLQSPDVRPGGE